MPDPNPAPAPPANPADPNPNPNPNPAPNPEPNPNPNPNPEPNPAPAAKGWGETWRQELAGDDEKALKQLERFQTPKALWDSYQQAYQRIRSGELKAPLAKDATPEQVTAWRKENGIPEKPEEYLSNLPNGLVIGEDDKPIFDSFVAELHKVNADPKVAHAAVAWYHNFQEEQAAQTAEQDAGHKTEVEDALRTEWGADYRANVNQVKGYLSSLPKGVGDLIANARGPDGRALLNNPDVMRALAQTAREINPAATIVAPGAANQGQAVEDEINSLKKLMGNKSSEYWKGPKAENLQARYRQLITAQEKLKARAA